MHAETPAPGRWRVRSVLRATAILVAAIAIASFAGRRPSPDVRWSLHARPADRFGVGSLRLGDPIIGAASLLGTPSETHPDLFGVTHAWRLDGFDVFVGEFTADGAISALTVVARRPGPRATLFGGVEVGASTLAEVLEAWGPPSAVAESNLDDYLLRYDRCLEGAPVVVKFDAEGVGRGHGVVISGVVVVDAVLVAYADEPPCDGGT